MKNKLLNSILLAVGLTVLIALPVLAYTYRASYTVTENASNTYSMLPVITASKNSWMASNGFMLSTAMDTRVETLGGLVKPHMVTDSRTLTVIPVSANSQTNLYFTTGSANLSNMSIIAGYGGNLSVTDAQGIELGANFSLSQTGWIDTTVGANKWLWNKTGAITTNITGAGNITTTLNLTAVSFNLTPDGAGTTQNISTLFGAATHWQSQLTNDGNTTYIENIGAIEQMDTFSTSNYTNQSGTITQVAFYFVGAFTATPASGATFIRTHGANYQGNATALTGSYAAYNTTYTSNPNTGVAWTWAEINDVEIGVMLKDVNMARSTQVYATVYFIPPGVVVATNVASDNHTVTTTLSSSNLSIYVDGVLKNSANTFGAVVVDNANNITINTNNVIPYATNITLSINGTQQLWYSPNDMIIGSVLPNRASTSNNATINWGANPTGINVLLGSMVSTGQPVISQVTDTPSIDVMPDIVVPDWFQEPAVSTTLANSPFRPLVTMVSDPSSLTEQQAWRWWGLAVVLGLTIWAAKITHGHWAITGVVAGAVFGAETAYTIWPWWGLLFVAMCVIAGQLAQTELGTNRGQ